METLYRTQADSLTDRIVDALATQGWVVVDDVFTPAEVQALREACLARWDGGDFRAAAVGKGGGEAVRSEIRSDSVLWLNEADDAPAITRYFDTMDALRVAVNRGLYLGLADLEAHFAVYPAGSFYKKHLDRFRDDDARTLTSVFYLNEGWPAGAGGELRLYLDADCRQSVDIRPQAGTMVLFLSDRFWHEVLPARRQRLSLTGWFRRHGGVMTW
ncbi:2OG-Fe(II) oxygenase [Crenobacter intestini]|uniref:2OG-Fe(II) oxygenase n=1 Tax=Crenobacter intestini TaxID=2563443 RepID=A0A4T0UU92_9NEIS|nr:2OG-Fe(II) oxygenase [Crenobacter intestini]TIC82145.1 2OG-Fe(II) oxygenase [Crenobacter intestini]